MLIFTAKYDCQDFALSCVRCADFDRFAEVRALRRAVGDDFVPVLLQHDVPGFKVLPVLRRSGRDLDRRREKPALPALRHANVAW